MVMWEDQTLCGLCVYVVVQHGCNTMLSHSILIDWERELQTLRKKFSLIRFAPHHFHPLHLNLHPFHLHLLLLISLSSMLFTSVLPSPAPSPFSLSPNTTPSSTSPSLSSNSSPFLSSNSSPSPPLFSPSSPAQSSPSTSWKKNQYSRCLLVKFWSFGTEVCMRTSEEPICFVTDVSDDGGGCGV